MWRTRRILLEPMAEAADCGYLCISALLATFGRQAAVDEIKEVVGRTNRGLSLRQVRDGLRLLGVESDAVYFDKKRIEAIPCPGVLLYEHAHFVVVEKRKGDRFHIYDPLFGWNWINGRKLSRKCGGLGIQAHRFTASSCNLTRKANERLEPLWLHLSKVFEAKKVRSALVLFALAQLFLLALPLLSMWAVSESVKGVSPSLIGQISLGFLLLTATNTIIALAGDLVQARLRRRTQSETSRSLFIALAAKDPTWFEGMSPAGLHQRIASLDLILNFRADLLRSWSTAAVSAIAGCGVIYFISPALLIPGLLALALSIILDLMFERRQHQYISAVVDSAQRNQSFVLDTLSQLPMIARHHAVIAVQSRYRAIVRHAAFTNASLQSLKSWRKAAGGISKSAETLFFVTLAASFMGNGEFALGGFVALGAYKDLLSGAISTLFQSVMERRAIAVHALQASSLFDGRTPTLRSKRSVEAGAIEFCGVSFAYGTLDNRVLSDLSFVISAGEFAVFRGPSGTGKSTIVKLLTGQITPDEGSVSIDGVFATQPLLSLASILQSDRLINGSIKDNVTFYRRDFDESQVMDALRTAQIDEFVMKLPMGLNTQIGESVGGLSGGQKQRILIARAIISNPKLIVLDEATASLDVATERRIFEVLKNTGATIVAVAHRPEVWALADQILDLNTEGTLSKPEFTKKDFMALATNH